MPRIRVFNKIDHVGDAAAQAERETELRALYPGCVVMSARRPDDAALHQLIVARFQRDFIEAELFLAWSAQLRGEVFANCEVLRRARRREGALLPRARRPRHRGGPARADRPGLELSQQKTGCR